MFPNRKTRKERKKYNVAVRQCCEVNDWGQQTIRQGLNWVPNAPIATEKSVKGDSRDKETSISRGTQAFRWRNGSGRVDEKWGAHHVHRRCHLR